MRSIVDYEIERKFLIKYPDVDYLLAMDNCQPTQIEQTYLKSAPNEERRVRKRGWDGDCTYTKTTKSDTNDPARRIESEEVISPEEYHHLLAEADPNRATIIKTRYLIRNENGQNLEIDTYPESNDRAVLEIELPSVDAKIDIPPFIEVIREVTGDKRYKNSQLAKNGGKLPED